MTARDRHLDDDEGVGALLDAVEAAGACETRAWVDTNDCLRRLVRASDPAHHKGLPAQVALLLTIPERTAQTRLETAEQLGARPRIRQAAHDGRLTARQAELVLDELELVDPDVRSDIEDELLAGDGPVWRRPAQLQAWLQRRVIACDPVNARERRHLAEREETGVRYRSLRDGLATSTLTGPAALVQEMMRNLDRMTPPVSPEDDRTRGQLQFATVTGAIADAAQRAGVRPVPVELHLDLPVTTEAYRVSPGCDLPEPIAIRLDLPALAASLVGTPFEGMLDGAMGAATAGSTGRRAPVSGLDPAGSPLLAHSVPELIDHGPVDPALVGELLGRAVIRRVWHDRLTGSCAVDPKPVALTEILTAALPAPPPPTEAYESTADQVRVVRARYLRCAFPGCTRRARRCDNDHGVAWPDGETAVANLHPLCRHHHQLKQQGWEVTRHPDGSETWTSPWGRTYRQPRGEQ